MKEVRPSREQVNSWFTVNEVASGVFAIGEPYHLEEVFCYLVRGRERDLLIDTGMGVKPIRPVIDTIQGGRELVVVNTHGHFDHIGGNREFEAVLTPANDWESRQIRRGWSLEDLEKYEYLVGFTNGVPDGVFEGDLALGGYNGTEPVLGDGSVLDLGGRRLTVIETPGHTPGGICLWDSVDRLLFTSDLIYDGPIYCFGEGSNLNEYWASLVKVMRLVSGGALVFPGHNCSKEGVELVSQSLALFERCLRGGLPDDFVEGKSVFRSAERQKLSLEVGEESRRNY